MFQPKTLQPQSPAESTTRAAPQSTSQHDAFSCPPPLLKGISNIFSLPPAHRKEENGCVSGNTILAPERK